MRDLPTGTSLLSLARDVLLSDLMPLLPPEARLGARLVANSMAIAAREAAAGDRPGEAIVRELEKFYRDLTLTHRERADDGEPEVLRRFAHDLRIGAFEHSEPRDRGARDILWKLTTFKLRHANPRFLAANGFR
jgi:hypothetical protein